MHTPSTQIGKGGAGPSHAPFPHVQGGAAKGEGGWRALVCANGKGGAGGRCGQGERVTPGDGMHLCTLPSMQMGNGGAGGGVPLHAPSAWPGGKGRWRRRQGEGAGPRAPFRANGERGVVVCPCAHSFHANGNGKGGPRREGESGSGGGQPSCAPSVRMGGVDKEEGRAGGTGRIGGSVTMRRTRMGHMGEGEGMGGTGCPCAPPFHVNKVVQTGGKGQEGERGRHALMCPPFLHTKGQRAAVNAGEGEDEGATYPGQCTMQGMGGMRERGESAPECAHGTLWWNQNVPATYTEVLMWQAYAASATGSRTPSPSFPPSSPPTLSYPIRVEKRTQEKADTPFPCREGCMRIRGTQCLPPFSLGPPFSPVHTTTFAQKGGAQGHAAATTPSPVRSTPFVGTRGPWPLPFPLSHATLYAQKGSTRPAPFPICVEGGCTRALRPTTSRRPSPFPLVCADRGHAKADHPTSSCLLWPLPIRTEGACEAGHPPLPFPFARKGGSQGHTALPLCVAPAPALFPFPLRATPFVQKGGTQGHTTPTPLFPIRAEGGCMQACHPGTSLPLGCATLSAWGTRGHATPHPSPFALKGVAHHPWPIPFPLGCAAPYAWERCMQGPGPTLPHLCRRGMHAGTPPHSHGKRHTRPSPTSPHVVQQGRHGLCAPTPHLNVHAP
ncbi:hypothetical protein EDB85DRAFT_1897444 [Lactarius pseudohatsudake]|nr:hypothetical protein EDB85DRAFT_1897444 [Lactarius pseudohatsudake]